MLSEFPLEILLAIFRYFDVIDIILIRRVSRFLNDISRRRDVWFNAYHYANFPRPPGPYISQSACDLETALCRSFRLSRNLRRGSGAAKSVQLREVRDISDCLCISFVFGRFLIVALREEVRCYDLDLRASTSPGIIHKPTTGMLTTFCCAGAIDAEGRPFMCIALIEKPKLHGPKHISIHSLNVTEESKVTLDLLHHFEHNDFYISSVEPGSRVIIIQNHNPEDETHLLAIDVHTRTQFLFPSSLFKWKSCAMQGFSDIVPLRGISTSTHLLFVGSLYYDGTGWIAHFWAFPLPSPNTHTHECAISLIHSHSGIIPHITGSNIALLQDAVVDPATQDTLITIQVEEFDSSAPSRYCLKYGTLRLARSANDIGTIKFEPVGSLSRPLGYYSQSHPSFDGTGQMFYRVPGSRCTIAALEYDFRRDRHSGELPAEVKVIERPHVLDFGLLGEVLDYDPHHGRICLEFWMDHQPFLRILDLAV